MAETPGHAAMANHPPLSILAGCQRKSGEVGVAVLMLNRRASNSGQLAIFIIS